MGSGDLKRGARCRRHAPAWLGVAVLVTGVSHCAFAQGALSARGAPSAEAITISAATPGLPMPHFWEQMFGSGRAILSLRDSYRQDLRAVKNATDLRYIRFHNVFHDEVGLMSVDEAGRPAYNFSYVDQIYDGLLENGVRPFVEIGFMPTALTSNPRSIMSFWYRPNVAPPKSYAQWDDLVRHFVSHLVGRYGIDEVAQWYFEVWNEPNIEFWSGKPAQPTYLELYAHTARDIKSIDQRLRVGGPATAQAAWVTAFLRYARTNGAPVDFVSSHVYANDTPQAVFGEPGAIVRAHMVCRAVKKLHDEIRDSPFPALPLVVSEFNASYKNEPQVTDSVYMGPWLAGTIRECAGLVDLMSYWSFSDVFEEQGVVKTPFYGGFGLVAERGIPKPAYNAFALLHKLGERRIPVASESALVTKRSDGMLVIALWNYSDPDAPDDRKPTAGVPAGSRADATDAGDATEAGDAGDAKDPADPASPVERRFTVTIDDFGAAHARLWRLDTDHGNVLRAFEAMGRPAFPSPPQIAQLRAASELSPPEEIVPRAGKFEIRVPRQGLALLEVSHPEP